MPVQTFTPRLTYQGTQNLDYYQSSNIYQLSGFGMPNCTAYAYGRWKELLQDHSADVIFPTGDGGQWYQEGIDLGYRHGNLPRLGAAASWTGPGSHASGPAGHVAIVEGITYDALGKPITITFSNSAYNRNDVTPKDGFPWFWIDTENYDNLRTDPTFLGFIYHPIDFDPGPEPEPYHPGTEGGFIRTTTGSKIFLIKRRF